MIFAALYSKSVSEIFKILFETGNINNFVLCSVFLVDIFNQNAHFLTKKRSALKPEPHFSRGAIEI